MFKNLYLAYLKRLFKFQTIELVLLNVFVFAPTLLSATVVLILNFMIF